MGCIAPDYSVLKNWEAGVQSGLPHSLTHVMLWEMGQDMGVEGDLEI